MKEYGEYWQAHLRLRDWDINYILAKDPKETKEGYALVSACADHSLVNMIVLAPEYIPKEWTGCKDFEVTIVHELLHVRFHFCIPESKKTNPHEEAAIELTAIALVANRRGMKAGELR